VRVVVGDMAGNAILPKRIVVAKKEDGALVVVTDFHSVLSVSNSTKVL